MRQPDELRPVTIEPFPSPAAAAFLITQGDTRVLCTASIASNPPRWIEKDEQGSPVHGWVTAEYNMIPGSTPDRIKRGPNSRGTEIQRLIGRSLRAAVDLYKMPGVAITVDCEVLYADGGTRTASITGGYVALASALKQHDPAMAEALTNQIAAVSVGICDGTPTLDLDYPLDSNAEVDLNVIKTATGEFIELQGTGEKGTFSRDQLNALLDIADIGLTKLFEIQSSALASISVG